MKFKSKFMSNHLSWRYQKNNGLFKIDENKPLINETPIKKEKTEVKKEKPVKQQKPAKQPKKSLKDLINDEETKINKIDDVEKQMKDIEAFEGCSDYSDSDAE